MQNLLKQFANRNMFYATILTFLFFACFNKNKQKKEDVVILAETYLMEKNVLIKVNVKNCNDIFIENWRTEIEKKSECLFFAKLLETRGGMKKINGEIVSDMSGANTDRITILNGNLLVGKYSYNTIDSIQKIQKKDTVFIELEINE